jgi:hypothetical protein
VGYKRRGIYTLDRKLALKNPEKKPEPPSNAS